LKDLKPLISFLRPNRLQRIKSSFDSDSLEDKLYRGIINGQFNNDNEALKKLYPTQLRGKESYAHLKNRLYGHLINLLFLINPKS